MGLEGYKNILSRAIYSCIPEKEPSNTIIIYIVGHLTKEKEGLLHNKQSAIVSECQLPVFLFTNSVCGGCACVERSSSGNIQVWEYPPPGNNVSEHAQIHVYNIIAFIVTKHVCLRAGECRPCVETELTATKNLATVDISVLTTAYNFLPIVADSRVCSTSTN